MVNFQDFQIIRLKYFRFFLVCMLFFVCQVALQFAGGVFSNEFGGYSDEAGHYITGLLMHDYFTDIKYVSPMEYAENYYLHYPKVALGHWPPFFYITQFFWTIFFPVSRISMMLLIAFITTLLSGTVYLILKRCSGSLMGIGGGILLIVLPLVQKWSGMLMAEMLVALLCLWAVLCLGRFIDTEKWQWSIGFGVFSTLAILTKGNGLVLLLTVPFALFFGRRFYLVKRLSTWYPLFMVLLLCGPWYWVTLNTVRNGMMEGSPTLGFIVTAIPFYSAGLVNIVGLGLFPLVVVGLIILVIRPYLNKETDGKWASLGALLVCVWLFHVVVPAGLEARHLITAVPVLVILIVAGLKSISKKIPFRNFTGRKKELILTIVLTLVFLFETFDIPNKAFYGFDKIAQQLLSDIALRNSVILISSDARGEGAFISEVAMREQRPSHIVLRVSKILSTSRWDGSNLHLIYNTPEEIADYLYKIPVEIVVIDMSVSEKKPSRQHSLLKESLEVYSDRWECIGYYSITRDGVEYPNALLVYAQKGIEKRKSGSIRLDMREMLGKFVEINI